MLRIVNFTAPDGAQGYELGVDLLGALEAHWGVWWASQGIQGLPGRSKSSLWHTVAAKSWILGAPGQELVVWAWVLMLNCMFWCSGE